MILLNKENLKEIKFYSYLLIIRKTRKKTNVIKSKIIQFQFFILPFFFNLISEYFDFFPPTVQKSNACKKRLNIIIKIKPREFFCFDLVTV